jgi:hypothetical protein
MDEVPWISPYFPDTLIRLPPNSRQIFDNYWLQGFAAFGWLDA